MELSPQDKQPVEITESHEITTEPQVIETTDIPSETAPVEITPDTQATEAEVSPEEMVERKEAQKKAEKRSRGIGFAAMLAAGGLTYVGFKTGQLDMVRTVAESGEVGWISASLSAAGLTGATYNLFKK